MKLFKNVIEAVVWVRDNYADELMQEQIMHLILQYKKVIGHYVFKPEFEITLIKEEQL